MNALPRFLPQPLPAVAYVPEYAATGALHESYEDMKRVFQVPWMGVVTMAFAHYPHFFAALWSGTRELAASDEYVAAARSLRATMEDAVATLEPPPIVARLTARGYAARELDDIRAIPEMLSHGNYLYTLLTTAARSLLEGGELGPVVPVTPYRGRHAPPPRVPLVLMEAHHVDASTSAVFDDVKATVGLPFLNTDYRSLARWPSYFALAWNDLRPHVGGARHEALCDLYQETATTLVARLPNPAGLTSAALRAAADRDAAPDLVPVVQLFHHLHAGLMTNVAFFRAQLLAEATR